MAMNQTQIFWNRSEKWLIAVCAIAVILGIAFIQWMRYLNQLPSVSVPTPTMPSPNAFDYFNKSGSLVRDSSKVDYAISIYHATPPYGPDDHPYTQAEKEKLVRENADALTTLRRGFAYPYVNPPVRSFSTLLPYYTKYRQLARLLTLEGQVKAARGDWSGAIDSNIDAIHIGVMVPHGSVLIGSLVGIACEAIGRKPIWENYRHLNAAQCTAAAQHLETLSTLHVPFADTLKEEKWTGQAGMLEILRMPDWPHELATNLGFSGTSTDPALEFRLRMTPKRLILDNYTKYMDHAIAAARKPYAIAPSMPPAPSDPVSQLLVPVFDKARIKPTDNEAQDALLATTLALQAYHQTQGSYPISLAALAPKYLAAVPADPFAASGPLHYRRTKSSYILYSVGPDGKDDGGRAIFDKSKPAPSQAGTSDARRYTMPDSKGDIVAGVNIY